MLDYKVRGFHKNIYLWFISYAKAFDYVDHDKLGKLLERWETIPSYLAPEKSVCGKKQQLEPCMEQPMGSRLRKVYDRAVCCHPVCLTYMLTTA